MKTTASLGSKLNKSCRLRLLADSKGYVLDDTGLYLATRGSGGKHVRIFISSRMGNLSVQFQLICYNFLQAGRSDAIVNCDTEKDVFETLGFPWLEPHERNL
jgi:DNA polymerase lambda